jgi:hypothetical protein
MSLLLFCTGLLRLVVSIASHLAPLALLTGAAAAAAAVATGVPPPQGTAAAHGGWPRHVADQRMPR